MKSLEKPALQAAVAVACLVPLGAGAAGMLLGPGFLDAGATVPPDLDSHFRYLSGLLLAIGLGFMSTIPRIEARGPRFRLLTGLVVGGGLGRLAAVLFIGPPSRSMAAALAMELAVTPCIAIWRERVEFRAGILRDGAASCGGGRGP